MAKKLSMKDKLARSKAFAAQNKEERKKPEEPKTAVKSPAAVKPKGRAAKKSPAKSTPVVAAEIEETKVLVVDGIPLPAGFTIADDDLTMHGVKINVELHGELSEYARKRRRYSANIVGKLVKKSLIAEWDLEGGKTIAHNQEAYIEFFKQDPELAHAIAAYRHEKKYSPEPQSQKHIRFNTTKKHLEKLKDFCKRLKVSQAHVISHLIERGIASE